MSASITPKSRETAEALLVAADQLGLPARVVESTRNGYRVPDEVAKRYRAMADGRTPAIGEEPAEPGANVEDADETDAAAEVAPVTPDDSWKNADIEEYAADAGIDLGGATKKADMLAAIDAATGKKE